MVEKNALKNSANITISAVAGALASVFFYNWIEKFSFWIAGILIVLYTLLVFVILYFFFKE